MSQFNFINYKKAQMGSNKMGYTPVDSPFPAARLANVGNVKQNLAAAITRINDQNKKDNTSFAYDPKVAEYYAYCRHRYAGLHESVRYTVSPGKLHEFLFYHAMRNKYDQGGKKGDQGGKRKKGDQGIKRKKGAHGFDKKDFESVLQKYGHLVDSSCVSTVEVPDPENPVGFSVMNTYKAVVYNVWMTQVANQSNSMSWDMIFTMPSKELMTMVKNRKVRIDRQTYKEKIDADFAPFTSLNQIASIERALWHNGSMTMKAALPGLRNRFTFLACYSGLLRSESLFLGELSDMFGIEHKCTRDPHPYFISIMQIATGKFSFFRFFFRFLLLYTHHFSFTGKTVTTKKQYGRSMRHKDVRECAICAFAFYLLFRFAVSGEMDDGNRPDFTKNEQWFDIKILSDGSRDNCKVMNARSYTDPLRKIFQLLGIITSHYGHFGRVVGPVKLEFEEVAAELIRILGESAVCLLSLNRRLSCY
jgi:hypothetical protein